LFLLWLWHDGGKIRALNLNAETCWLDLLSDFFYGRGLMFTLVLTKTLSACYSPVLLPLTRVLSWFDVNGLHKISIQSCFRVNFFYLLFWREKSILVLLVILIKIFVFRIIFFICCCWRAGGQFISPLGCSIAKRVTVWKR